MKILHLQENLAFARKSCFCKKILRLQENLAFARKYCFCKKILLLQENIAFARKSCFCKISWLIETAMHSSKKMLHLQEKSCLYKKILRLQENLAKARNLCICNKILQKQEYLSTKCKGAVLFFLFKNNSCKVLERKTTHPLQIILTYLLHLVLQICSKQKDRKLLTPCTIFNKSKMLL